jgi:pheromone alpha factor receptor
MRQPIFLLNIASIFLIAFQNITNVIVLCASYRGIGQSFLGGTLHYPPSTWTPIILGNIVNPFIYAFILTSLVLQVRVVFAAEPRTRLVITIIGAIATSVEFVLNFVFQVYSIIAQLGPRASYSTPTWLYRTFRIYFVACVGISCLIFLYKLALTIYRRRRMGISVNQFGPLQIVFIMFVQSLIVPVIFYILDLAVTDKSFNNFNTLGQTFLVCSLPLSALWASAEVKERGAVNQSSQGTTGSHSRSKFRFFSRDEKKSKDSDIEKAPSYSTDRDTSLHPPFDCVTFDSDARSH